MVFFVRAIAGLRARLSIHLQPILSKNTVEVDVPPSQTRPKPTQELRPQPEPRNCPDYDDSMRKQFLKVCELLQNALTSTFNFAAQKQVWQRCAAGRQKTMGMERTAGNLPKRPTLSTNPFHLNRSRNPEARPLARSADSSRFTDQNSATFVDASSIHSSAHSPVQDAIIPARLAQSYLWYRLVQHAVVDRGRADFVLAHGCPPAALARMVCIGWIALGDALRWADARAALGDGLILLEQAQGNDNTGSKTPTKSDSASDSTERPGEADVASFREGWRKTMPEEEDLVYDWPADRKDRCLHGPFGARMYMYSSSSVDELERVTRQMLASSNDLNSADIPEAVRPALLPLVQREKFTPILSPNPNPKPTPPPPQEPPKLQAHSNAELAADEKKLKERIAIRRSNAAPQPQSTLQQARAIPTVSTSLPIPVIQPAITTSINPNSLLARLDPKPPRRESLEDHSMHEPPEYTEVGVDVPPSFDMEIDSPSYQKGFNLPTQPFQAMQTPDVEMIFVGNIDSSILVQSIGDVSMSPPPQYATLAPIEPIVIQQAPAATPQVQSQTHDVPIAESGDTSFYNEPSMTDTAMTEATESTLTEEAVDAFLAELGCNFKEHGTLEDQIADLEALIKEKLERETGTKPANQSTPKLAYDDENDELHRELERELFGDPV